MSGIIDLMTVNNGKKLLRVYKVKQNYQRCASRKSLNIKCVKIEKLKDTTCISKKIKEITREKIYFSEPG